MLFENTNILPEEARAAFIVGSSGFGGLVSPHFGMRPLYHALKSSGMGPAPPCLWLGILPGWAFTACASPSPHSYNK